MRRILIFPNPKLLNKKKIAELPFCLKAKISIVKQKNLEAQFKCYIPKIKKNNI